MTRHNLLYRYLIPGMALFVLLFTAAQASGPSNQKSVQGVSIYLGVVPASIITDHDPEHPERKMHGGAPGSSHSEHIMVALFDEETGERIRSAEVTAEVSRPGLQPEQKELEPMAIAGAMTFGNYFKMAEDGTYRIELIIQRKDQAESIGAVFEHEHRHKR